jgi:hypothetical protein
VEPAVCIIRPAEAALNFVGLSGFECALPGMDREREVVRMKNVAAGPVLQFLKGLTKIVQFF